MFPASKSNATELKCKLCRKPTSSNPDRQQRSKVVFIQASFELPLLRGEKASAIFICFRLHPLIRHLPWICSNTHCHMEAENTLPAETRARFGFWFITAFQHPRLWPLGLLCRSCKCKAPPRSSRKKGQWERILHLFFCRQNCWRDFFFWKWVGLCVLWKLSTAVLMSTPLLTSCSRFPIPLLLSAVDRGCKKNKILLPWVGLGGPLLQWWVSRTEEISD